MFEFISTCLFKQSNVMFDRFGAQNASTSSRSLKLLTTPSTLMQSINDTLPTELLFQIFHHLDVVDGPLGLGGALFVCRLWNAMILNDSHLWTNLVLTRMFIQRLVPSPAKLLNYLEKCGTLSGDHFIHMSVDIAAFDEHLFPDDETRSRQGTASVRFSLLAIARAMTRAGFCCGRIRTLVLSGGHAPSSPLRMVTSVIIASWRSVFSTSSCVVDAEMISF